MPLIGQDFLPSRPTDGEYVRHPTKEQGATVLRSLRARIKDFFDKSFNVESGDLRDDILPSSALQSGSPNPAGTYRRVRVTSKGLVTGGDANLELARPRAYRAYFFGSESVESRIDKDDGYDVVVGVRGSAPNAGSSFTYDGSYFGTGKILNFYEYEFIVPESVTRMRMVLSGGSPFYSSPDSYSQDSRMTRIGSLDVTQGQILKVFVGMDASSPCRVANFANTWYVDSTQVQFGVVNTTFKTLSNPILPGFGGVTGNPGVVYFEWYA